MIFVWKMVIIVLGKLRSYKMKQTKLNWLEKNIKRGVGATAGMLAVLGVVGLMPEVFQGGASATGEPVVTSDTTLVQVNLQPMLAIGIYDSSTTTTEISSISINAAAPTSAGAFYSEDAYVGVATNAANGYTLKISVNNTTSNALVHSDTSKVSAQIGPAGTNVTSSTMGVNTWGYAVGSSNYNGVPLKGSPATIKTTSEPTAASGTSETGRSIDATQVSFGTKVSTALPAGTYSNQVLFTAVANAAT